MNVWIDKKTGTWGDAADLVIIEVADENTFAFDEISDTEISYYAKARQMMKEGVLWPIEKI